MNTQNSDKFIDSVYESMDLYNKMAKELRLIEQSPERASEEAGMEIDMEIVDEYIFNTINELKNDGLWEEDCSEKSIIERNEWLDKSQKGISHENA